MSQSSAIPSLGRKPAEREVLESSFLSKEENVLPVTQPPQDDVTPDGGLKAWSVVLGGFLA